MSGMITVTEIVKCLLLVIKQVKNRLTILLQIIKRFDWFQPLICCYFTGMYVIFWTF